MKSTFAVMIAALLLVGLAEPLAHASELKLKSAECGDHWLTVEIDLDPNSDVAKVSFSGDSNPEPASQVGSYVISSDFSLVITLDAASKSRIDIDGSDHHHNLFWGSYFPGNGAAESSLGLCTVTIE